MAWALASVGALALALLVARQLLHAGLRPGASTEGLQPADLGMAAHEVRLPAGPGLQLFAWYLPPAAGGAPAPGVVLLHGWGGNASHLLGAAQALHRAGYAVLLPESRNHGRSDRAGHSSLPRFADDLEHALDWLAAQADVDPQRLAALGHSVGAAAVLLVASRRPALAAAVAVGTFAHPEQVMRRWLAAYRVPYWPLGWVANRYVEWVIGASFSAIAPLATLPQAHCPVLLLHGTQDDTVPLADAQELLLHKGRARVSLVVLDGTHEGFVEPERAASAVLAFLAEAFGARAGHP